MQDGHLQKTTDIPVDRLTVSYSRSSGPGGQHVNKVNTKAEIRFHIHTADWIPEDVRQKIIQKNKNRINKSGELFVTSEISRYQMRNFADCLQKIRDIITEASFKPREASEEDTARRKNRLEKINQERLKQKKMHSSVKQSRRVQFD
ncbi:large ribosomal subunit protein mL62 isoform X2 [Amia ocellicauda]|uniref:large ribosomal subunit protein mL62 isoform X2 n=1 Tax=Amia ocellicauda TaxID=2972642 RepID=UPI00346416E7